MFVFLYGHDMFLELQWRNGADSGLVVFLFEYVEMGSVLIRKSTRCVLLYVSQIMKFDELMNFYFYVYVFVQ
jgi:hypothetical protein